MEKLNHTFQLFKTFLDTLASLLVVHASHEVDIHFSTQLLISYLAILVPALDVRCLISAFTFFHQMISANLKNQETEFKSDGLPLSSIVDYLSGLSLFHYSWSLVHIVRRKERTMLMNAFAVSPDPHISHKIILLLADLARLCPELTCQSMMPIFTFVGAHVFERDDAFSARVVDKVRHRKYPTSK